MARNLFVFFFIFFLGLAFGVENDQTTERETFKAEIECARAGGICIHRGECPNDKVSEEGQCPIQSNLGAVCCHSLSSTETRCQKLGGQCKDSCGIPVLEQAKDCPKEEKCCPLV